MDDVKKRFLTNTDETGRFIVKSLTTGKTYYVEPIGNGHPADWEILILQLRRLKGTMVRNILAVYLRKIP